MVRILYLDKYIAVCHKSAGLLSEGEGKDSLPTLLCEELRARGISDPRVFVVHRLDRETEGVMVYALCASAAAKLSAQIGDGRCKKIYNALLWGSPASEGERLCDLLYYDRARSKSYVVERERKGVKSASLDYRVIRRYDESVRTLVEIELHTGRTHQIRVQFASRGFPICGDRRYGAPAESGRILALAAVSLSFAHPYTSEEMTFEIEPENIKGAVAFSAEQKHTNK